MHQSAVHRVEDLHRDTWAAADLRHEHLVNLLEQNHSDDWDDRRRLDGGGGAVEQHVHLTQMESRLKAVERGVADGITVTRSELQSFRLESAKASDARAQAILDRLPLAAVVDSASLQVRTWDIVKELQERSGAQTLLQLLTPTTSALMPGRPELRSFLSVVTLTYASAIQQSHLGWSHRLPHLADLITWFEDNRLEADIVFVDPWHTYEDSVSTLLMALDAVPARGGFVVVHDCNPAHISQIGPMPRYIDDWCGETWRAFIDVGSSLPEAWRWCVVDTDLGVGVIEVPPTLDTVERAAVVVVPTVPNFSNRDDAWSWLEAHRRSVMRLVAHGSWLDEVRGYG